MSLASIASLLRQRTGLNPESVGDQFVLDAATRRMKACATTRLEDYAVLLQTDLREAEALIEEIVVLESWFFRELSPFRCLREFVDAWRRRPARAGRLRVLSIPCSRGEEPYSIVMTLLDHGLTDSQFQIIGVDLSRRALAVAAAGRFGASAFREQDETSLQLQQRYFRACTADQLEISIEVRQAVTLQHGNLIDASLFSGQQPFDVIFCRNLIIYLDFDARQTALDNLRRLLAPGGMAYFGHTESRLAIAQGWKVWNDAYLSGLTCGDRLEPKASVRSATGINNTPIAASSPVCTADDPMEDVAKALDEARQAANAGRLDECIRACERMLSQQQPQASVYCLLGVVRTAQGNSAAAEECFQRALYLDPRHQESLVHMSLLCEGRGDTRSAENYSRRAMRSARKEEDA